MSSAALVLAVVISGIVSALVGAAAALLIARRTSAPPPPPSDAAADRAAMRDTVTAAATEALHANRAAFLDLARTAFEGLQKDAKADLQARQAAIDALVRPVAETLKQVQGGLETAERERVAAFAKLGSELATLGATTHTLSKALRSPSARGRWGEMQLRRVVELAGMLEHCDFEEQRSLAGEAGRLRPDLLVRLPEGRCIAVDAKAPLEAFLDAQEAGDDETRVLRLQAHARQVRAHMDSLGSRAYWDALTDSPEMVVMFLPGETLFGAALEHDLGLVEYGLQRRVLLASPITLIALLTTVAHAWRQDALAENYREVARVGKDLHERLATFAGHFDDVRKRLDGAVQAYNAAAGSFESRVLVSARRLRELEVTTAEPLAPPQPIDRVPRVLRDAGLMGLPDLLPEEAVAGDAEPV